MTGRIKLSRAVVVEGRYDKSKLCSLIDGVVIVTNGFQIYKDPETRRLIRMYAEKQGIIVMTDSDAAGRQIRGYIKSILPRELHGNIVSLHIPQVRGKERRKTAPSAEGTLGVEGIDAQILRGLLMPYAEGGDTPKRGGITKSDLYELGLSGGAESREKRADLARRLGLPSGLSANALLDLLNSLYDRETFLQLAGEK
ncbi:MAG: DUF4093 domain-containing protein [Ruminococcus sp.]|nr:DUF4093 domain-containing protein [Ruminococcus sp.]